MLNTDITDHASTEIPTYRTVFKQNFIKKLKEVSKNSGAVLLPAFLSPTSLSPMILHFHWSSINLKTKLRESKMENILTILNGFVV